MSADDYEFTQDRFAGHAAAWLRVFARHLPAVRKVLEIGCFEGQATAWLAAHGVAGGQPGAIVCVDEWGGPPPAGDGAEARFDRNVAWIRARHPQVAIAKHRGPSPATLPLLVAEGHAGAFDFIHVAGCQHAAGALADLVFAFMLCRPGGVIACDGYAGAQHEHLLDRPKLAVDGFTACYAEKLRMLVDVRFDQLYLQKLAD